MPPSLVLEVMKILEAEIDLREDTRAVEQARPALEVEKYTAQTRPLAETQESLGKRVADVVQKIGELPEGPGAFAREIGILSRVEQVMLEAHDLLATPDTGPPTIAAETEAIELLLQARRINPSGGGGGGATPGGGGTGEAEQAALALIGAGDEVQANVQARSVQQATGVAGGELPAEFRSGLDAFFGALENEVE